MCRQPTTMLARGDKNILFSMPAPRLGHASTQIGPLFLWPKRERPHSPRLLIAHGGKSVGNAGRGGRCHAPPLLVC